MSTPVPAGRSRLESIDVVRGVIMILMALDHVRDFFGTPGVNPTAIATTTAPLFFTRWITHVCAPVFSLLMGTGACFAGRHRTTRDLSRYLFTRGVWLIVLELTVMRCLGFQFNADYRVTMLLVLWALGWSLIVLSVLVWLPTWLVVTFGVTMIAGHHLLSIVQTAGPIWSILHGPGFVLNHPRFVVFAGYPLIPWIGVTAAGFGLARVYEWNSERRKAFLLRLGLAATAAFVVLRFVNLYGDPSRWSVQPSALFTLLSFLNTTKYPPSLLFLLMTLGPALVFLSAVDGRTPAWLRPAVTFGRVPMFYFLLHLPLIHVLAVIVCYTRYGAVHWMFESPDLGNYPFTAPPGWGFSLPVVYLVWVAVVVALYPACRWFMALKQRRTERWLKYV